MKKITNLLVSLLALFGTVISARADLIVEPMPAEPNYTWAAVLVIVVVIIVALNLLRHFRKK